MEDDINGLERKHVKIEDVKRIILQIIKEKIDRLEDILVKETMKYPEVKAQLLNAFNEFEETIKNSSMFENKTLGFDMITVNLNPMMNIFQHIMSSECEYVAYLRLRDKVEKLNSYSELPEAFSAPEPTGSYYERSVMMAASKNYKKIWHATVVESTKKQKNDVAEYKLAKAASKNKK